MASKVERQPVTFTSTATFDKTITGSSNLAISGGIAGSSDVTSSGKVTANGGFYEKVETVSTTGATLQAFGVSLLTSTVAAAHTLPAPVAGVSKVLYKSANSTAVMTVTVASTATQTFDGTNTAFTLNGLNQYVNLVGASSTRWLIQSSTAYYGALA